jgi:sugar phosphate permease
VSMETPVLVDSPVGKPAWARFFHPAAPIAALSDPQEIELGYAKWRKRVRFSSIIGYAMFYLVRKNLAIAMPVMEEDLHLTKGVLGLFLTLHGVIYGISKLANGFLGDRCNARSFLSVGLAASAILNLLFGFGSSATFLGIIWMLNGLFQGMGFPPCARLLTHWFTPKQLPSRMSLWNTSHCIGAIVILLLCSVLIRHGWRLCFFVPAAISLACVLFLWFTLPDTPPSVGLPELAETKVVTSTSASEEKFSDILMKYVFTNKYVWLVSIANFFVYTLRYAVFDWGTTVLKQSKHIEIQNGAWMLAGFEAFGAMGALLGGWFTTRWFGGRPMRASVFFMVGAVISLALFWKISGNSPGLNTGLLCCAGFFIYGPQCLVGIAAANLATKKAAATAVGLTGFFGYMSTILSGWGLGTLVQHHGWDAGFEGLVIVAIIGTGVFALGWKAQAHGYTEG